jgi:hypothetical protein
MYPKNDIIKQFAAVFYRHRPPPYSPGRKASSISSLNETPPSDKIAVRIDLENLIIEGRASCVNGNTCRKKSQAWIWHLKFTDRPGTNIRNVNLSVEEWRVVSYVNPKNSIRQIARAARR